MPIHFRTLLINDARQPAAWLGFQTRILMTAAHDNIALGSFEETRRFDEKAQPWAIETASYHELRLASVSQL
jgi:hypothetical protein